MKKKQDMMQPLQRTGLKQFQHHQQKQRRHLANKIIKKGTA
ncbi:Prophage LambdaBa02, major tail protein [Bacillus cereus BDRD-ST26]|nr:Prophage LambdaBa02, major tail protein [Bacillus cereus BDRD-ST26]